MTIYEISSGGKCKVTNNEDFKVEYLSEYMNVKYYKYEYNEFKVCTAIEEGTYKSGKNLLYDYDKVCGYSVEIENVGSDS